MKIRKTLSSNTIKREYKGGTNMLERILVATDGSEESLAAAKMADKYIEKGLVKEVHLLNVAPNFASANFEMAFSSVEDLNALTRNYGEKILDETAKEIENRATIVKKVILGDAPTVICEYAKQHDCGMIIMGSRGNSQLKGLLLGSVSTKVLHYAECPVLIVKA